MHTKAGRQWHGEKERVGEGGLPIKQKVVRYNFKLKINIHIYIYIYSDPPFSRQSAVCDVCLLGSAS